MTTNIEQEFFKVFGIEQKNNGCEEYYYIPDAESCKECEDKPCLKHLEYPQITSDILLELICILGKSAQITIMFHRIDTKNDLKNQILEQCIETAYRLSLSSVFASKIQQLFKEEE